MKRIWIALLTLVLAGSMVSSVRSVGGDTTDPAVTLSYLEQVLRPALTTQYQALAANGLTQTYAAQLRRLVDTIGAHRLHRQQANHAPQKAQGTVLFKKGDVLTLAPGGKALLKSGTVVADTSFLVDVTNGVKVLKGAALRPRLLYMMADTDTGELRIASDSAELQLSGVYTLSASAATDYGSMARALSAMGLFQGTGTGFSLESGATRAQGLVMFLRILGLEEAALAYGGPSPFTDVPQSHWAYRYVAYAYDRGLTTGTAAGRFSPDAAITCQHYTTFLLRALHYEEPRAFSYATALADAAKLGLFSKAEMGALSTGTFLRSEMVYLSFYGLFGVDQQAGELLLTRLVQSGAVAEASLSDGLCQISGTRIS